MTKKKKRRKKKAIGFDRLAASVTREYLAKGFAPERAAKIGRATAGKVARLSGK